MIRSFMRNLLKDPYDRIALFLGVGLFLAGTCILGYKYFHYGFYDWDFALYAHAMWNLAHGSFYSSLWGTNFLVNHAEYIAIVLAPLYALIPHPMTLLVLKVFSLSGGAFVFYLIAKDRIGPKLAIIFMLVYALYPPNLYMLVYEFHFENLAVIFIFLLFYFYKNQNLVWFSICALLAALIKENIALVVAMFGIAAIFSQRDKKAWWTIIPLAIGGGLFYLSVFIITPYLRAQNAIASANAYVGFYMPLLEPKLTVLQNLLINSDYLFANLANPQNLSYLKNLFAPMAILPFLSPQILFFGAPLFAQHLLSSSFQMKMMHYHYAASVVPFVFIATMYSLGRLQTLCRPKLFRLIVAVLFLACGLQIMTLTVDRRFHLMTGRWGDHLDPVRRDILKKIPAQAPAIATFEFLPELSNRKDLYTFYKLWRKEDWFSRKETTQIPPGIDYAIFDWEDMWLWRDSVVGADRDTLRVIFTRLKDMFLKTDWQPTFAVESLTLFEKGKEGIGPLVEIFSGQQADLSPNTAKNLTVDQCLTLKNITVSPATPMGLLPLTFEWQSLETVPTLYRLMIQVRSGKKIIAERKHFIGYGIYPTILWQKGDLIRERYWLMLPPGLPKKDISLAIYFVDNLVSRPVSLTQNGQPVTRLEIKELP